MKGRITRRFARVFLLFIALFHYSHANAHLDVHNVLVLHSYDPSYEWTHDLQQGIESAFDHTQDKTKLSVEYLDAKRINSATYCQAFIDYFGQKYLDYHFDAIIVTDDHALEVVKGLAPQFKPNTPIVAVGINNVEATLNNHFDNARIYYSRDRLPENLKMIGQLRPNMKKLYFLTDQSVSAQHVTTQIREAFDFMALDGIELVEINDRSLDEASTLLAGISPDDAVLLSHFNTELENGVYHTYDEIAYKLSKHSVAPIFVLWKFYIHHGVLGGYVNHSEQLGHEAAHYIGQQLDLQFKEKVKANSTYRPIFSYHALQNFGYELDSLPDDALVMGRPKTVWQIHGQLILVISCLIAVLVAVIIAQWLFLRHRRIVNRKNRKILNLQKEMIWLLGEAIETRSGETGNHVKRVAKLSAHMATLLGLTNKEIKVLEAISPMHDIGKISIPDYILEKPGKLTPDEWDVMKTHTTAGFKLLSKSKAELFQSAAIVAHEHHERWDGRGYPNGIREDDIHIYARITTIADVFDALLSKRCYKDAWELNDVIDYFDSESGKQFDPQLTSLLINHIEEFAQLRNLYPD
ncbi:HD domain-containing phosphohydrolase [Vibrio sonorensis]|uniref:HD domain-containing phosphohydrolase n=1 Tax=Vibrio sonorensis TaxID=1004316 RepID=UPI0008DB2199|nr:HD domain-containing phosphohydrolase [Vibrio sonorensis]